MTGYNLWGSINITITCITQVKAPKVLTQLLHGISVMKLVYACFPLFFHLYIFYNLIMNIIKYFPPTRIQSPANTMGSPNFKGHTSQLCLHKAESHQDYCWWQILFRICCRFLSCQIQDGCRINPRFKTTDFHLCWNDSGEH